MDDVEGFLCFSEHFIRIQGIQKEESFDLSYFTFFSFLLTLWWCVAFGQQSASNQDFISLSSFKIKIDQQQFPVKNTQNLMASYSLKILVI